MPVEQTTWSDERLDDLAHRVDDLARRVDAGFDRVDARFNSQDARFDSLQRMMVQFGGAMIVTLVGAFVALFVQGG